MSGCCEGTSTEGKQLDEADECLDTGGLARHLHNDAMLTDVNGPHTKLVCEDMQTAGTDMAGAMPCSV